MLGMDEREKERELGRLLFCLEQRFPAEVTTALLLLARGETITLGDVREEWDAAEGDTLPNDWDGRFAEAVGQVDGEEPICCNRCDDWVWLDDAGCVADGDTLCDDCISKHYSRCEGCEEYHLDYNMMTVEDTCYCEGCRDGLSYCDDCETYYIDTDHDHDGCDCEAPRRAFQFPANGAGTVANDTRLDVELPAGTIDDAGLGLIRQQITTLISESHPHLNYWTVSQAAIDAVGDSWLGQKGNYTRRLSRELYTNHGVKVPAGMLSEIGNMARAHSSDVCAWPVEFTRDLNMSAGEFCHEGSCWWQGYSESRCALKNWGGLAIRVFDEDGDPNGRAWVQPFNADMQPTHDAENAHAYVVYNCYGALDGAKAARIVAHLTGRTYRKVGYDATPQYVNGSSGWLVADETTCQRFDTVHVCADSHDQCDAHVVGNGVAA